MSFQLKDLLALYLDKDGSNGDAISRGFGAEALYQFYFLMGVDAPSTTDLTKGLLGAFTKHIRAELAVSTAEAYLWDTKDFLQFCHDGGWSAIDWSQCLSPKLEYRMVTPLMWQMRGRRG